MNKCISFLQGDLFLFLSAEALLLLWIFIFLKSTTFLSDWMTLEWTTAYVERDYICQGSEYDWGIDSLELEAGRTDIMEIPTATK